MVNSGCADMRMVRYGFLQKLMYPSVPVEYYHASEDHKLKSLSQLTDIYYESVGRNSLLLLNLTPNQEGLILAGFLAFGRMVSAIYL